MCGRKFLCIVKLIYCDFTFAVSLLSKILRNKLSDEEPLISGTEDGVEEVSEETMNVWENLLEDWTDFCTRPPELVKLARKVCTFMYI